MTALLIPGLLGVVLSAVGAIHGIVRHDRAWMRGGEQPDASGTVRWLP